MEQVSKDPRRAFAVEVVRKLRHDGYVAYWAGGCVRDRLLGRAPKDFDVATDALPEQIRAVFGHRRTLALGAAFGVITVLGPRNAGQIEVATFRRDLGYTDGRHPDGVSFSSPEEDAARRDFTINGLFFDPLEERVLDFVGGQRDLAERIVRAIGDPHERFREDKLRLIRAVRFAAALEFTIEPVTLAAVREMAGQIGVVSVERIAAELQRILTDPHRAAGLKLLWETGLLAAILPECGFAAGDERLDATRRVVERLTIASFPLGMAALLHCYADAATAEAIGRRLRLSNPQIERIAWLLESLPRLADAPRQRWSQLQPVLVHPGAEELLDLAFARAEAGLGARGDVEHCRVLRDRPRAIVDPPPLLDGNDLIAHGVPPGPEFRRLLQAVRDAQLDGELATRDEALRRVDRLRQSSP